jgi:hypothetical protein
VRPPVLAVLDARLLYVAGTAGFARALSDEMSTLVALDGRWRVLGPDQTAQVQQQLALHHKGVKLCADDACAVASAKQLGADQVLVADVSRAANRCAVLIKRIDVASGSVLQTERPACDCADSAVLATTRELTQRLSRADLPKAAEPEPEPAPPPPPASPTPLAAVALPDAKACVRTCTNDAQSSGEAPAKAAARCQASCLEQCRKACDASTAGRPTSMTEACRSSCDRQLEQSGKP